MSSMLSLTRLLLRMGLIKNLLSTSLHCAKRNLRLSTTVLVSLQCPIPGSDFVSFTLASWCKKRLKDKLKCKQRTHLSIEAFFNFSQVTGNDLYSSGVICSSGVRPNCSSDHVYHQHFALILNPIVIIMSCSR